MKNVMLVTLVLTLASCAAVPYKPYAREAKKKPGSEGVIALKLDHVPEDRLLAENLMGKNCGANQVEILEEGEVVVGSSSTSSTNSRGEKGYNTISFGSLKGISMSPTDYSNSETTTKISQEKEWQINYRCKTEVAKNESKSKKEKLAKNQIDQSLKK